MRTLLAIFVLSIMAAAQQTVNVGGGRTGSTPPAVVTVESVDANHNAMDINCLSGCTGGGGGGGTSSNFGASFPVAGTAIGVKNGANMVNLAADGSSNLLVNINAQSLAKVLATVDPITFASPQAVTESGTWNVGITGSVAVTNAGTFAVQATEAGTWNVTVNTALPTGTNVIGHIIADTGSTTAVTQATAANLNATVVFPSAQPVTLTSTTITGTVAATQSGTWNVTVNTPLPTGTNVIGHIICDSGCSGASSFADNAAFTAGTTPVNITAGWYSTSPTNCTSGSGCAPQLTLDRKLFVQSFQGTSPWVVSNSGTFAVQAAEAGTWNVTVNTALPAGSNVIGHVIADSGSTTAVTGTVTVSGTVTANAGTNLNTSALALDTSVNGILNAQGATTSGETGPLVQGAVTTAAPTYTTAKTDPLSLTTAGALRVDGSGVTQPVSLTSTTITGTVAATQSGTWNVTVNTALPTGSNVIGHVIADSGSTTAVTGNVTVVQPTGTNLHTVLDTTSTTAVTQATGTNLHAVLDTTSTTAVTQATGTNLHAVLDTTSTTAVTQATASNLNAQVVGAGADGSATSGNPVLMAGKGSGNARIPIVCDNWKPFSLASTTSLKLVTLASAKQVYICSINVVVAGANNVALIEGTKTTTDCDTATAGLAGGTTAATGWNFAANGGLTQGTGIGVVAATATVAHDVCLHASASTQVSGVISWTQF